MYANSIYTIFNLQLILNCVILNANCNSVLQSNNRVNPEFRMKQGLRFFPQGWILQCCLLGRLSGICIRTRIWKAWTRIRIVRTVESVSGDTSKIKRSNILLRNSSILSFFAISFNKKISHMNFFFFQIFYYWILREKNNSWFY